MSTTTTEAIAPGGTWHVDALHSSVSFSLQYTVARFSCGFKSFDATLEAGDDLRLSGTADVESIAIDEAGFKQHLMGDEFFDAERHPQLTFASTAIRRDGERVEVEGELSIRGVSQPIAGTGTLVGPIEGAFGGTLIGLELHATLDRTTFGLEWNAPLPKGGMALANEVTLELNLRFRPES